MYMGVGFLFAALTLVAVIPNVHNRAVRLTRSRLRAALPQSMEEIEAKQDLLRAEFAMSTCRFENRLEQLKHKSADQLAETNADLEALKADKNSLRAEFATSTCRIEKSLEQLKHQNTDRVVELDKRAGVINRLKIERDALKVELIELNAQLDALKQTPIASSEKGTAKARRARSSRGRLAADSNDAKQRAL